MSDDYSEDESEDAPVSMTAQDIVKSARREKESFRKQIERLAKHPHFGKDIRNSLRALKRDQKLMADLPNFRRSNMNLDLNS